MPGVYTLKAESALSGSLEGFELCVFNLYYYFSTMQLKKKVVNGETNQTKPPKYMNKLSQSVLVVP